MRAKAVYELGSGEGMGWAGEEEVMEGFRGVFGILGSEAVLADVRLGFLDPEEELVKGQVPATYL